MAAAGTTLLAGNTTSTLELCERQIALQHLPLAFQNYRIGVLSDPHLGVYVPTEWVDHAVSLLEQAKIDLLLMGGDYIWYPDRQGVEHLYPIRNPRFAREEKAEVMVSEIFATVADLGARLNPPDGRFGVLGNHDGWTGPHLCKQRFQERGIRVLENELVSLSRGDDHIRLFGTADYWTGIPTRPKFQARIKDDETRIVLTHNPDYTSELLSIGYTDVDLAISGHTHGGQIKLPLVGALHGNVRDTRFREGLFSHHGLISYTSRGVGVVEMPFRINCPAEVTVLELVRA